MDHENTNWQQSTAGVCIQDHKVLLARHTYGGGKGKLIIPGGYLEMGETPQQAVCREFLEETGITVQPQELIGIRFNAKDWYVVFRVEYISGEPTSDGCENSEVIWMDTDEALSREDVPQLTKIMIAKALSIGGFTVTPYTGSNPPHSLYTAQ